jgi:hypothetical protein
MQSNKAFFRQRTENDIYLWSGYFSFGNSGTKIERRFVVRSYFSALNIPLTDMLCCYVLLALTLFVSGCADEDEWEDPKLKKRLSAFPNQLITDVEKAFGSSEHIRYVFEYKKYEWLKKTNIYCFYGTKNHSVIYAFKDFEYTRLDCKEGVRHINKIIQDYQFSSSDFEDNQAFTKFLKDCIVNFYHDPRGLIMTETLLREMEQFGLHGDMQKENNEEELRKLFFIPVPHFINGKWECKWNVLNCDGSICEWDVTCEYDPEKNSNTITKINVQTIKPVGSCLSPYIR